MSLHLLEPGRYERVVPLLDDLDIHLAARAVVSCAAPGSVYVDDRERPHSALIRAGYRFHLAGDPHAPGVTDGLRTLFRDTIYPDGQAADDWGFTLDYAGLGWEPGIDLFLAGKHPIHAARHYYAFDAGRDVLPPGWAADIPPRFALRRVDETLMAEEHLENLEHLREEMASECPSVEFFIAHRFGVCLVHDDTIAAWCLSEYNCAGRCEVGIETIEPYRQRGLGTITTRALIEAAMSRGIHHVGWHCWADNAPSIATALRAGLEKKAEYAVYFAYFDEASTLAVHGNICLRDERHEEAIAWYRRAFEAGEPPAWAWANAAAALAGLGDVAGALEHVGRAIDAGFADREYFETSQRFHPLRVAPGWNNLMARLGH